MINNDEENIIQLAGCVIIDDYDRMLLLHRYKGEGQWELPGGKVEEDESPELAAMRELAEELGVAVELTKKLGNNTFEQGDQTYMYHWFQAKIISGEPEVLETSTFDDFDYFELDDLPSLALSEDMLVLQGRIVSGDVVLG